MRATSCRATARQAIAAAGIAGALALALAACGGGNALRSAPPVTSRPPSASMPSQPSSATPMPSMSGMPAGNGLASRHNGYTLSSDTTTLPAGKAAIYRFTITGPDGRPVTDFALSQTKRLHLYAIRSDLTGFQHVHPTMAGGGTWTTHLATLQPGSWRLFTQFTPADGPGKGQDFVLSRTVTVPGRAVTSPLPAPSSTTMVDGYTLTLRGDLKASTTNPLTVTVRKSGTPVTDLQPYLGTYAHLTAFHQGDTAFRPPPPTDQGHRRPRRANPELHDRPAASGNWRLYLQVQTAGTLHTAAVTLHVN
ncbi:hypothetical protein ABT173_10500 [Streptomyces sp. NPDC001795]|uniref:hypothetical protein n=1 Tax=Streptomyces sp. NPDC001795 TaxID=3154525 RepID=UPI00332E9D62